MSRPRLLDLFCGQGGAAKGYHDIGFDVVGVDIEPQPRYPYWSHACDAVGVLRTLLNGASPMTFMGLRLDDFDAIHASPPCQAFTTAQRLRGNEHPDLIAPVRDYLDMTGLPYVIENVCGAPLKNPAMLCGTMFGLELYRHRVFETNWHFTPPPHGEHFVKQTKMGRPPVDGEFMQVVGNFSGVSRARKVMGMPWASQRGLSEAIPPAYTEYIGAQLMAEIIPGPAIGVLRGGAA